MRIIQPFLLGLLLFASLYYFRRFRAGRLDRVVALAVIAFAAVLLIHPDLATRIAHAFGVGRGVDLFIYVALFGLAFLLLAAFSAIRDLRAQVTELTRALALLDARAPQPGRPPSAGSEPVAPAPPRRPRPRAGSEALVWTALALAVAHHGYVLFAYHGLAYDQDYQIACARTLLRAHRLGERYAHPADLSITSIHPQFGWPAGYPVAFAALLASGCGVLRAAALLDVAAMLVFFLSWYDILRVFDPLLSWSGRVLVLLWWALVASPLYLLEASSLVAIAAYSAALALTVRSCGAGRRSWLPAAAGVLFAAAAWFRFAYWPLIVVGPVALWLCARSPGGPDRRTALIHTAVIAFCFGLVAASQRVLAGDFTYLNDPQYGRPGLHFQNLLAFAPFPAGALGFTGSAAFMWLVSIAILLACGAEMALWFRHRERVKLRRAAAIDSVLAATGLGGILTVAMLCWLSVRWPLDSAGWTYVQEQRYYAPAALFLYLALACLLARALRSLRGKWPAAALLLVLLACAAAPVNAWVRSPGGYRFLYANQYHLYLKVMFSVLDQEVQAARRAGRRPVYIDSDLARLMLAGAAGARIVDAGKDDVTLERGYHDAFLIAAVPDQTSDRRLLALQDRLRRMGAVNRMLMPATNFRVWELDGARVP